MIRCEKSAMETQFFEDVKQVPGVDASNQGVCEVL